MVRSELRIEGLGFVLPGWGEGLFMLSPEVVVSDDAVPVVPAASPSAPPCLCPCSLIFDLENIASCRDEGHGVYRVSAAAHLVVKMRARGPSSIAHITDAVAARDPFTLVDPEARKMGVARGDAEGVTDLDHQAVTALPTGKNHRSVAAGMDRRAARSGEIGTGVKPPPAIDRVGTIAEARGHPHVGTHRDREWQLLGRDAVHVELVERGQNLVGPERHGVGRLA